MSGGPEHAQVMCDFAVGWSQTIVVRPGAGDVERVDATCAGVTISSLCDQGIDLTDLSA